jgi:hypothetical protein
MGKVCLDSGRDTQDNDNSVIMNSVITPTVLTILVSYLQHADRASSAEHLECAM